MQRFAGTYDRDSGGELELRVDAGRLKVEDWVLVPIGEDRFLSTQDYGELIFAPPTGDVAGFEWSNGGSITSYRRRDG